MKKRLYFKQTLRGTLMKMVCRQPFGNTALCDLWDIVALSVKIRAKMESRK